MKANKSNELANEPCFVVGHKTPTVFQCTVCDCHNTHLKDHILLGMHYTLEYKSSDLS